jgi:hypothetical protein
MDGIDLASVIRAALEAAYAAELEREFQRLFTGDIGNWRPTGLLSALRDEEVTRDRR